MPELARDASFPCALRHYAGKHGEICLNAPSVVLCARAALQEGELAVSLILAHGDGFKGSPVAGNEWRHGLYRLPQIFVLWGRDLLGWRLWGR